MCLCIPEAEVVSPRTGCLGIAVRSRGTPDKPLQETTAFFAIDLETHADDFITFLFEEQFSVH